MLWHLSLLLSGIVACSLSVVLIKICAVHAALLASYRLMLAALLLLPWFIKDFKRHRSRYSRRQLAATLLPGAFLALHFITWNIGARLTPAANATLLVNLVPVVTPLLLYLAAGELITRREALGTAISLAGAASLSIHDFGMSAASFRGDMMCLASAVLYALYFALGRRNRGQLSIILYVVPLYFSAGVFCLLAALPFTAPLAPMTLQDAACIAGLALVPTVIGHSLINNSLRFLRGQTVSIIGQSQIVFGGLFGYLMLDEIPPAALYPAGALVIAGAALSLTRRRPSPAAADAVGEPAGE